MSRFDIRTRSGQISSIIQGQGAIENLLDIYLNASAAYSFRKLRSAYSGAAIRVRRSEDNTEQDIGYAINGFLDTSALLTFCGFGNGFITTWYDQSGNFYNQIQTTATNQPQIVSSGSLILTNTKASALLNGSSQFMSTSTFSFNSTQTTIIALSKQTAVIPIYKRLVCIGDYSGGYYLGSNNNTDDMLAIFSNADLTGFGGTAINQNLSIAYNNATNGILLNNGTQISSKSVSSASYGNKKLYIGSDSTNFAGEYFNGNVQEVIVYPIAQSSINLAGIQTNINAYYGIY